MNLGLKDLTAELVTQKLREVRSGHASDLLSEVLANAHPGALLVTIHMNVIAVASHARLSGVIFTSSRLPDEEVRKRALEERVPLFSSKERTFDVVGRLYRLGLRAEMSTARDKDSVVEAFKKFAQYRVRRLLVVNGQGDLVGILTGGDIT